MLYLKNPIKEIEKQTLTAHIVQFGTIKFCWTLLNYFGQFLWIEKKSHYNSRVSLHEAPTKKAK